MDEWVAFLNARLDEDEAAAVTAGRSGFPGPDYDPHWRYEDVDRRLSRASAGPDTFAHVARQDPARVLREVAAKRAILGLYEEQYARAGENALQQDLAWALAPVILLLATVYSGHPDYRAEWAAS